MVRETLADDAVRAAASEGDSQRAEARRLQGWAASSDETRWLQGLAGASSVVRETPVAEAARAAAAAIKGESQKHVEARRLQGWAASSDESRRLQGLAGARGLGLTRRLHGLAGDNSVVRKTLADEAARAAAAASKGESQKHAEARRLQGWAASSDETRLLQGRAGVNSVVRETAADEAARTAASEGESQRAEARRL